MSMLPLRQRIQRLFDRVTFPEPNSGCTLWSGAQDVDGYGRIDVNGSQLRAHRVAWEMRHGPAAEGLVVMHVCDTPLCVNPDHLRLGTIEDNISDRVRKGRNGAKHPLVCANGHAFTNENTYTRVRANGSRERVCRACKRARDRRSRS